jgi:hypothetical protein
MHVIGFGEFHHQWDRRAEHRNFAGEQEVEERAACLSGGPRKGQHAAAPRRESMALNRFKCPPASRPGRPSFWERPSHALPDRKGPARGSSTRRCRAGDCQREEKAIARAQVSIYINQPLAGGPRPPEFDARFRSIGDPTKRKPRRSGEPAGFELALQIWGAWERPAKLLPQVGASVIVPEKNLAVPGGPHLPRHVERRNAGKPRRVSARASSPRPEDLRPLDDFR